MHFALPGCPKAVCNILHRRRRIQHIVPALNSGRRYGSPRGAGGCPELPVVFPAPAAPEGRCWPKGKAGNSTYSRLRAGQTQDPGFSDTLAGASISAVYCKTVPCCFTYGGPALYGDGADTRPLHRGYSIPGFRTRSGEKQTVRRLTCSHPDGF